MSRGNQSSCTGCLKYHFSGIAHLWGYSGCWPLTVSFTISELQRGPSPGRGGASLAGWSILQWAEASNLISTGCFYLCLSNTKFLLVAVKVTRVRSLYPAIYWHATPPRSTHTCTHRHYLFLTEIPAPDSFLFSYSMNWTGPSVSQKDSLSSVLQASKIPVQWLLCTRPL